MNNETISRIEEQIGHKFCNRDLLQQAFIRRSYSKENGGEDNEVLEFVGDKALDLVIVKKLTEKYGAFAEGYEGYDPKEDFNEFVSEYSEGKLTALKKKLVCREMLARRIRIFGFQYELIMGKSDIAQNIHEKESVQEDLFEAIIGAVALDTKWDLDKLVLVVDMMLDPDYYLDNKGEDAMDCVELVQQWYQKKHGRIPVYCFKKLFAPNSFFHSNLATYSEMLHWECWLGLPPIEKGFAAAGKTQREARMAVAERAYEYLESNNLLFDLIDEVGEPDRDRAINQLQELYQKGYINEPWYDFAETYDEDGNPVWRCECHIKGQENYWHGDYSSKKQGKKSVAYDMLCDILEWEDDYET